MTAVINLSPLSINLKRKIRAHLKNLGFVKDENGNLVPPNLSKDTYRKMHSQHRKQKLEKNKLFLEKNSTKLIKFFASGSDIDVNKINPRIELILPNTIQSDLFRFASLYWQVPVSEGYGRRIRFLVWDDYNDKIIGIFALGDAVFNLKVRDNLIGWDHARRSEALVNMMDAYVLGALPPYNQLLGGKLIACLLKSKEVKNAFKEKYKSSTGIISGKAKKADLVLISTTSSLGKSSVYNRLKLNNEEYFQPIGYTSGFGHFHIPDSLFEDMRAYLDNLGDKYAHNFSYGQGPNWRMRTIRKVLNLLGMPDSINNHGLPREVFLVHLASNCYPILVGTEKEPNYSNLKSVKEISKIAIERWMIPRAERMPFYKEWKNEDLLKHIYNNYSLLEGRYKQSHGLRTK